MRSDSAAWRYWPSVNLELNKINKSSVLNHCPLRLPSRTWCVNHICKSFWRSSVYQLFSNTRGPPMTVWKDSGVNNNLRFAIIYHELLSLFRIFRINRNIRCAGLHDTYYRCDELLPSRKHHGNKIVRLYLVFFYQPVCYLVGLFIKFFVGYLALLVNHCNVVWRFLCLLCEQVNEGLCSVVFEFFACAERYQLLLFFLSYQSAFCCHCLDTGEKGLHILLSVEAVVIFSGYDVPILVVRIDCDADRQFRGIQSQWDWLYLSIPYCFSIQLSFVGIEYLRMYANWFYYLRQRVFLVADTLDKLPLDILCWCFAQYRQRLDKEALTLLHAAVASAVAHCCNEYSFFSCDAFEHLHKRVKYIVTLSHSLLCSLFLNSALFNLNAYCPAPAFTVCILWLRIDCRFSIAD